MSKKRPERTARRRTEREARALVRDREKLSALSPGGAPERPIAVPSAAVIDVRIRSLPCPQCDGRYRVADDQTEGAGLRRLDVVCQRCGVGRSIWFRIVVDEPN